MAMSYYYVLNSKDTGEFVSAEKVQFKNWQSQDVVTERNGCRFTRDITKCNYFLLDSF